MNIDSILVSDYAHVSGKDGKLTVVGAFTTIGSSAFPAMLTQLSLSLVIHGHRDEAEKPHEIEVQLLNHRRELVNLEPIRAEFTLRKPPNIFPGMPIRQVRVVTIFGASFPEPGPYAFEVYIDGTYHAAASLYVHLADPEA